MTEFADDHDDYQPKHRREDVMFVPGYDYIEFIRSPYVPKGTMYLGYLPEIIPPLSINIREDQWGPSPYEPGSVADREWYKSKEALEALLDDMCTTYGWDPDDVWRSPRLAEQESRRNRVLWQFTAAERLSMAVINPKSIVAKITGV